MLNKITVVFLALLLQACAISVGERNIIMQDEQVVTLSPADIDTIKQLKSGLEVTHLRLKRNDGATADGVWIEQAGSKAVIIYFSGNAMRIKEDYNSLLPELLKLKTDVVWLDHRGTGGSDGRPSVDTLFQDGLETYDYVTSRTNKKIVAHGMSLGSFVAGSIATEKSVDALILEGSATNTDDWLDSSLPWYMKVFANVSIEGQLKTAGNSKVVQQYNGPIFIIIGENDKVTPPNLSEKLYQQSISPDKHILVVKGRRHGDVLRDEGARVALRGFIERL
ncbi:MAG: alpha/beta hydrolase [Psychrosphaera sp.]|nr:alpha/beta hydrolase [Psychrosphaera sp.]